MPESEGESSHECDSQSHDSDRQSAGSDYDERRDFEHRLHSIQMRLLTGLARQVLPGGYWTRNKPARDDKKTIHLTFDDGPHPDCTERIIEMLAQEEVHATFFYIGRHVERYPHLVEMAAKAGHTIANHSLTHPFLPMLSRKRMQVEIDRTNQAIEAITGERPRLFRPPYGLIDKRGADLIVERQMSLVYWGAIADDWHYIGEDAVVKRIGKHLDSEELLVLHEGSHIAAQSIGAARRLIKMARDLGRCFEPIH